MSLNVRKSAPWAPKVHLGSLEPPEPPGGQGDPVGGPRGILPREDRPRGATWIPHGAAWIPHGTAWIPSPGGPSRDRDTEGIAVVRPWIILILLVQIPLF